MKVLLVLEATLGGTSRHVLDLTDALLEKGFDVHLVYSTVRADHGFLRGLDSLNAGWPNFRTCEIPITREVTASDFSSYLKLWRYVREHGPFDVIHSHSTKAGFLARLLPVRSRMVYTPHALMTMDPAVRGARRWAICVLESFLARRSAAVVVVSERELRYAIEAGIGVGKLTVIPNGIRSQVQRREEMRCVLGFAPETVCVGFVGRLCSHKEPGRVVQAFALLKQLTRTPVRLALIGSGSLEPELRKQATQLGLVGDVLFLGEVDGAKHIAAFDVLALTSQFEAFAYVVVEALAAGVPVVSTNVGAANELITDGVTGYICDPWDARTFADYLRQLVDDPQLRQAISITARERAKPFTAANMVNSVAQLYERICARPSLAAVRREQCETR